MTADGFLALLDGVKPTRRGFIARCPAHADKSPSLSICEGEDGRIVLHDFAGCEPSAICSALGLSVKDLFADTRQDPREVRRNRQRRETRRAAEERKRQREGARIDRLREAEHFIRSARNIPDSHTWSDAKRDRLLNQLADAYAILAEEEIL